MALFLYDDAQARAFEPFALTRPIGELRAGALLLRQRWERAFGIAAAGSIAAPHLVDYEELDAPRAARGTLPAGAVVANARCAVKLASVDGAADVWSCDGRVAAVRLARELPLRDLADGRVALEELASSASTSAVVNGHWIDEVWDLIRHLVLLLGEDIPAVAAELSPAAPDGCVVLGTHPVYVEEGAQVEPQVCLDATSGPILVRRGATVQAFTRLVGPCYIGEDTMILGGRVAASAVGEVCRVHGEVSTSVFLGHSNKSHDGFVGHSVLGRWSNLGAGTTTSNLKNTYGPVALWTPHGVRDTGLTLLGSLVGDHAKTGIGTRLTTGTVLGTGASIFGGGMPPKVVPPFAWGERDPFAVYQLEKFLEVAERVMARRYISLTPRIRRQLTAAYEARWSATS